LKLQDEIAKFGQLELSDVSAFYELPDGKVVSGMNMEHSLSGRVSLLKLISSLMLRITLLSIRV